MNESIHTIMKKLIIATAFILLAGKHSRKPYRRVRTLVYKP
jgi:hypothetical protein